MKGNQNGVLRDQNGVSCYQNGCERDAHKSPYEVGDLDKSDNSVPVDGSANLKGENEMDCVVPFARSTTEMKSSENRSDSFFVDKSVMECEQPKLVVCYREGTEHAIKDICVDEGVPCIDKIIFENIMDECQSDASCPHYRAEEKTDSIHEELDTDTSLPNGGKVSDRNELDKDSATLCSSKDLVKSGDPNSEATNMIEGDDISYNACQHSLTEQKCDLVRNGLDSGISAPNGQTVSESNELNRDSATLCSSKDLEKSGESKGDKMNLIEDYVSNGSVVYEYNCDSACPQSLTEKRPELVNNGSDTQTKVKDGQTVSERNELEKDSDMLCTSMDLAKSEETKGNMHDKSEESIMEEYKCDNATQHSLTEHKSELSDNGHSFPDELTVLGGTESDKNITVLCSSEDQMKLGNSVGAEINLTGDELSKETEDKTDLEEKESYTGMLNPDEASFSNRNKLENDVAVIISAEDLFKSEEAEDDETVKIEDDNSTQMTPHVALSPLQETGAGSFNCNSNAYDSADTNQMPNQLSNDEAKLDSSASVSNSREPSWSPEEALLATSESFAHESSKNITFSGELSDMEEGGSITFDFSSTAPVPSSRGEISQDLPKKLESQNASETPNGLLNARSILNQEENSHGEGSFSVSDPLSGRISYSGAIPFSGNMSVRSDGSAASTRSFAFPVLQTEWNSSPSRMARADRRALQKHRRWRYCILCCKF